ncbi:MAG: molybdenum cofactor guanylyltransferase [Synechococcaceae cyanobacterium]|nr:molybdenum cofactor guanylyltransferase [Synechococcaceae cyanobacterium]
MLPLQLCLLSGGASRRMGRDKALLPHPEGGCWLERTLNLLARLDAPITLFSHHPSHLQLATAWAAGPAAQPISLIAEPAPRQGPLLALQRLSVIHADQRLLLCPVDMPWLNLACLETLLTEAAIAPARIHLAHDGERRQPLLGVYPGAAATRLSLLQAVEAGERRLQTWLTGQACREVRLDPGALRNINRPEELQIAPPSR